MKFESAEEVLFFNWLQELEEEGFIVEGSIKNPDSYLLSEGISKIYTKELKTKTKKVAYTVLSKHLYTPDIEFEFTEKARDVFFTHDTNKKINDFLFITTTSSSKKCVVEVKPPFDQNSMTRLARLNVRWVYERYNVFINITIPRKLFEKTFYPGSIRFKRWKHKTNSRNLKEYLKWTQSMD